MRETLEQNAIENNCSCYHYQLMTMLVDLSDDELKEIADNKYWLHEAYDETYKDCVEWLEGAKQDHAETQMELERGN